MNLLDVVRRKPVLDPWVEGEKIPWDDPVFSERMLKEHLSQAHDAASRRFEKIDEHVDWIHRELLFGRPSRILDLGCGPGLYANRLARMGHECVGIDFSPASITYALDVAETEGLNCTYRQEDIRTAAYGAGFDLAMLIFGEFNAFRPDEAATILAKAFDALVEGGTLLLEVSVYDALKALGDQDPSWYANESGLFSDRPHLRLDEPLWHAEAAVLTVRYFIVDAATGDVDQYTNTLQAYADEAYLALVAQCGFIDVRFWPSLIGRIDETQDEFFVIVARKSAKAA